jgi:hypothetical protein
VKEGGARASASDRLNAGFEPRDEDDVEGRCRSRRRSFRPHREPYLNHLVSDLAIGKAMDIS